MKNNQIYDVAIVGGGVAGSSLAAVLAQAGLGVIVFEREKVFRDRVRGEGIHPWGVAEAEQLGLLPVLQSAGANELSIWQMYQGRERLPKPAEFKEDSEDSFGEWAVYHPDLQEALLMHAKALGAEVVRPAKVEGFRSNTTATLTVTAYGQNHTVQARLVVGADGRLSQARQWINATTESEQPGHHLIGGCLLDGIDLDQDLTHMGLFIGGFALIFPQRNRRARAYLVGLPEVVEPYRGPKHVDSYISACANQFPQGTFDGATQAGPAAFFPGENIVIDRIADGNVVLIGDAAGATDPSVGHGLSLSFRDARELRDLLLSSSDWPSSTIEFACRRKIYEAPIRCHARWMAQLFLETGPKADARRGQAMKAREDDPENSGYGSILTHGPDGLPTDEAARRRFFGELFND